MAGGRAVVNDNYISVMANNHSTFATPSVTQNVVMCMFKMEV